MTASTAYRTPFEAGIRPEGVTRLRRWSHRRMTVLLAHPERPTEQREVLGFIFARGRQFHEPSGRRYPVLRLLQIIRMLMRDCGDGFAIQSIA